MVYLTIIFKNDQAEMKDFKIAIETIQCYITKVI